MIPAPWIAEAWRELHELERRFLQYDVDIKRLWQHADWGHGWPVGGIPLDGGLSTTTSTTGSGADCDAGFCCAGPVILNAGTWTNGTIGSLPCVGFGGMHSLPFTRCWRLGSGVGCGYAAGDWNVEVVSAGAQYFISADLSYAGGAYRVSYHSGWFAGDPCGPRTLNLVANFPTNRCNPPPTVEVSF